MLVLNDLFILKIVVKFESFTKSRQADVSGGVRRLYLRKKQASTGRLAPIVVIFSRKTDAWSRAIALYQIEYRYCFYRHAQHNRHSCQGILFHQFSSKP